MNFTALRASDRLRQKRKVRRRGVRDTGVDPIDRKVDENLGQNPVDGWAGNIAHRQIALRDLIKCAHDTPDLRREALLQNLAASRLLLAAEIAEPAGGPIRSPALRKLFAIGEDLFDNEIGGPGGAVLRPLAFECVQARPQLGAVVLRPCEAVDVVDAHAVDEPLGVEAQRGVNGLEHFVILHADGDKLADVEEAAPIDFVIRGPPPSQTIVLLFEQPVQARASGRRGRIGYADALPQIGQRPFSRLVMSRL